MATVNKNFKVKNGLVVETTATVGGNTVLTENASDTYILNLIGGETLVKSVSGNLNVDNAGNLTVNEEGIYDDFISNGMATTNDISDAIALEVTRANGAYDVSGAAGMALDDANAYTNNEISAEVTNRNSAIANAKGEAIDAAESYTDSAISTEVTSRNSAIATAKGEANDYTDTAVSSLVNGAPALLDTLNELAEALQDNPEIISDLQDIAAGKQDSFTAGDGLVFSGSNLNIELDPVSGLTLAGGLLAVDSTIATKSYADGAASDAQANANTYAEGLISQEVTDRNNAIAALDTDDIEEGATNLYFTNARAISAVGGTIGDAINDLTTSDIEEGSNLYFTNQRAIDAGDGVFDGFGAASTAQTNAQNYADGLAVNYDEAGAASAAYSDAVAVAATDATNKANAAQTAAELTASNALNTAVNNLENYADTAEQDAKNYADGLASNYDANGAAATAETNANFYTDNAISGLSGSGTASVAGNIDILTGTGIQVNGGNNSVEIDRQTVDTWYDAAGSASAAQQAAASYTDNAVSDLVNGAPALLDTLNELAAALQDNPDIISDLQDVAAGKQDTLTAGSNIDITGVTISVTGLDSADISDFTGAARAAILPGVGVNLNTGTGYLDANLGLGLETDGSNNIQIDRDTVDTWYDAAGSASAAESNAEDYADGLAVNYDAAGSASSAQTAAASYTDSQIENLTTGGNGFELLNLNDESAQFAASSSSLGSVVVTAYEWAKADYRSAKLMVKIDNGTDNEVSEVLLTLDSIDNIAITEYAIVGTNGSRGTITADISGSNVRVRVNPVNDSTIKVTGTLLK